MKRLFLLAILLLTAACGSTSSSSSQGGSSSSSSAAGFQLVAKAALNGTALSDSGMTLYMFKNDSAGKPTCSGSCASTWPAEAAPASLPTVSGLSGTFGSVAAADGSMQLTYDGWPLYRYSGDKSPSDANGQGIGGIWFAVTGATTPNPGAAGGGSSPATTSAPAGNASSSSYNYYN